jgi:hypothetical protein
MPLLTQAYVDDKKAKVSSNDTTPGYLNGKLTAGTGVSLTEGSDGGDETLSIANTDTGSSAVSSHTGTYDHTLLHSPVTIVDSASVDFTLSGQQITAVVAASGVDHNSLNNLTVGDPHTQYQKESDFTSGSVLFRGASAITEDNAGLFYDLTNKRLGVNTAAPARRIEALDTTNAQFRATHTAGSVYAEWGATSAGYLQFAATGARYGFGVDPLAPLHIQIPDVAGASIDEILRLGKSGMSNTGDGMYINFQSSTSSYAQIQSTIEGSGKGDLRFVTMTSAGNATEKLRITANGNIHLRLDNQKLLFGSGQDFSLYYDGTAAHLKTDEVAPSDLQITTGAAKTLLLNTPVYDDLNFDPDRSGGPVATQPDSVTINNVFHREFTSANNQLCGAVQELPHGYKLSSTLYPHVHIFLKASETVGTTGVTFTLYWELRQSTGTTSGSVPLAATSAQLGTTAGANKLDIYDATGFAGSAELGAQLAVTIARTAGDAGDVVVTTYGVHYAIDTIGSRQLTAK